MRTPRNRVAPDRPYAWLVEPEPGAETSPQDSARLLNKDVRFRLEAENGEFRPRDSADWAVKAPSPNAFYAPRRFQLTARLQF